MSVPYRLSFTSGGLLFPETVEIARRYLEIQDWDALRTEALQGSLLRKTREASRRRYFREIRDRLMQARPFEIEFIAEERLGARAADFALCCRYYRLVGDFVREVLRDKIEVGDDRLEYSDYYHFLERKALVGSEFASISDTTRVKLRQVTFRMLAEGGIVSGGKDRRIVGPRLPSELVMKYLESADTLALEHLLYRRGGS